MNHNRVSIKYNLYILISIVVSFFLFSCASQQSLSGGEKDNTKPFVKSSLPNDSLNTNYKEKNIKIVFNENVQLNNFSNNFYSIPEIKKYKTSIKKNIFYLNIEDTLSENTTYNLFFNDCFKDNTEGNLNHNFNIVFSSGSYIDSLQYSGYTIDNQTNQFVENIRVELHQQTDSFNIFNSNTKYFTYTNKEGFYKLNNIDDNEYRLIAYQDKNNNKKWNPKDEIAYLSSDIINNYDSEIIQLSNLDTIKPKVKYSYKYTDYQLIKLNKEYNICNQDSSIIQIKDVVYFMNKALDFSKICIIDYDNNKYELELNSINKVKSPDYFGIKKYQTKWTNNLFEFEIELKEPIVTIDSNLIYIGNTTIDSTIIKEYIIDKNKLIYTIETTLDTIDIKIGKRALTTISRDYNETFKTKVIKPLDSEYGKITGSVIHYKENDILQLLNNNYEVIYQDKAKDIFSFDNLKPNTYYLRVLHDMDNNNQYTPGNVNLNRKSEIYTFYKEPIKLRSNWEINNITIKIVE